MKPEARRWGGRFVGSIFGQVVIAAVAGIALGLLAPGFAVSLKPLGDGFIKLIRMLVSPIVFCVVVHGIAGAGDLKRVGRVGLRTVVYFEVVTSIALVLGLIVAWVFHPGSGMNIDPRALDASAMASYADTASKVRSQGTVDFLMRLIPSTFTGAFTSGDVLQVLVVAVMAGCALSMLGDSVSGFVAVIDQAGRMFFRMMGFIVRLAPLDVLGAVAHTVGKYGIGSLMQLGWLVVLFYAAVIVFVVVILGAILRLTTGLSLMGLLRYLREELMIVLGTASSDAVPSR